MAQNYFKQKLQQVTRIKRRALVLILLHTGWLFFLTYLFQFWGYTRAEEREFFKWFNLFKHNVFGLDQKPFKDQFIFVDISKDPEIVKDTGLNTGRVVITDRKLLTTLFETLAHHATDYRFVLCDLSFDYPSPEDSSLSSALAATQKLVIAQDVNEEGGPVPSLFNVNAAVTSYTKNDNSFVKLPLFIKDTFASLPVKLIDLESPGRFTRARGFTFDNNKLTFNTIIPDFYYRTIDIGKEANSDHAANLILLHELLTDADWFNHYLKGKFILIGDSTELHDTYLGKMPGTLVLFNCYLTLRGKHLYLSWRWLLLVFIVYFLISLNLFITKAYVDDLAEKVEIPFLKSLFIKYIPYLTIMLILDLISYAFFGVFISLFFLATYLTFVKVFLEKRERYMKTRKLIEFIK